MGKYNLCGYKRGGTFGIRNHIIALSTVCCSNFFAQKAHEFFEDVIPITHQHGCDHIGKDREQVLRTLSGTCNNPNVAGVLLIGLGCENITVQDVFERIKSEDKIIKKIVVQDVGKKEKIYKLMKQYILEIKRYVQSLEKVKFDISELKVGLECGGSDPFSGITGNPSVGRVSDMLVRSGATTILSEIPELIGAKKALKKNIYDPKIEKKLFSKIDEYVEFAKSLGCDLLGVNPTPGNIMSGISSIEEKSLGCMAKAGSSVINEYLDYAQSPKSKGLVVMNTPGNDAESVTGMVAGGAQIILFTTGLGTPLGNPVAPVIKISTNTKTFNKMKDFLDIDAGQIINGKSLEEFSQELFDLMLDVCNGKMTLSEINRNYEFSINRIGPTF
ncbi:MAG TPA: UxaA family hydrolase [Candidatus Woesearchaeota archaeon]|nr:UxaA family hydrolase [Candidatus Woesearchaeota archaeon]